MPPGVGDEETDPRLSWLETRVLSSLKCKPVDWKKFINSESIDVITQFLDQESLVTRVCFICHNGPNLSAQFTPPPQPKKKLMYFLKPKLQHVTMENIDQLIVGDLSPAVLEQLSTLGSEVFLPLISSPANQEGLPDIVAKGVLDSFHQLMASTYVTIGQTKGRTLLPLPSIDETPGHDRERVHVLESAVVMWSNQIKNVLRMDPEASMKKGDNPGPLVELTFWESRAANLNSIRAQISSGKISKVIRILELAENTYYHSFSRQIAEVSAAAQEATEISRVLRPLRPYLEELSPSSGVRRDFPSLSSLFPKIMHLVFLVWKSCEYYRSPTRLVCLIREICNDTVEQARQFVDAGKLFDEEPEESTEKLEITLQVCGSLKDIYNKYSRRVAEEFPEHPWKVQQPALFQRLDAFMERCKDLQYLTETRLQFDKLSNIEIGGTKGKSLTSSVRQIHAEFMEALTRFRNVGYDLLNVSEKSFEDDFFQFRSTIKELERRLGSVLTRGFDDCGSIYSAFKLVESFEGLLDREIIHRDLEKKQSQLLRAYGQDLSEVQELFKSQRDNPPPYPNMPPTSGAIVWSKSLLERINRPMVHFLEMHEELLKTEEAKEILELHATLNTVLLEYQRIKYAEWSGDVSSVSKEKLKQPLLERNPETRLLRVNFDPVLVRLLREVHYVEVLNENTSENHRQVGGGEASSSSSTGPAGVTTTGASTSSLIPRSFTSHFDIPPDALDIFSHGDVYRMQTSKLELIVHMYNNILNTLIDVERPLIQEQLDQIDVSLEKGLTTLNWKGLGIDDFISDIHTLVFKASSTLKLLKSKVEQVQDILKEWAEVPLLERKDFKPMSLENFQARYEEHRAARQNIIMEDGRKIHEALATSFEALRNISKASDAWRSYVQYVNNIVVEGLCATIGNSLQYLLDLLDPNVKKEEMDSMLEIFLRLEATSTARGQQEDAEFSPYLQDPGDGSPSIEGHLESWFRDFMHVSTLLGGRIDTGSGDYLQDMQSNKKLQQLMQESRRLLQENFRRCLEFRGIFLEMSFLWKEDDHESFEQFLLEAPKENADSDEPSLAAFEERIAYFEGIQKRIGNLKKVEDIGWLQVDASPLKNALSSLSGKWRNNFTDYLHSRVRNTLEELAEFMKKVGDGIRTEVQPGDMPVLKEVMGHIRQVINREKNIEGMWDPLKEITVFLRNCHSPVPDSVLTQLENYPLAWSKMKNRVYQKRAELSPLQDQEAESIKEKVDTFADHVADFRRKFEEQAPFRWMVGTDLAYEALDTQHHMLRQMEEENQNLMNLQALFGLSSTEFKALKTCRSDLINLKEVWDLSTLVKNQFDSWMLTPFLKVDVDYLSEETRKLQHLMRSFPSDVKSFGVYVGLEQEVNNMLTTLPLISELRNPAMRLRHWQELLEETGKPTDVNPEEESFCLQQMIELDLHDHVEAVSTIVDKAMKESNIDKNLSKIKEVWETMQFEFEEHEELHVPLMKVSDEVMEAVEDHQMLLQGMASNRNVAFFSKEVTFWSNVVGAVDEGIRLWINVQNKWTNLYPIFVLSADIREQLPEDSKRFLRTDDIFRRFMEAARPVVNIVEACYQNTIKNNMKSSKDFISILQDMENELVLCEKALADYLETKRKIFPRFYFVSSTDLVDILSKGSTPHLVMKHIGKLVDSLDTLTFEEDANGHPTSTAVNMISKEGEEVAFRAPFQAQGAVESWLSDLISHIGDTLRGVLSDSVTSYGEPERDAALKEWLAMYPAQIVSLVSRIWWTRDVDSAFGMKEEGNQYALRDYNRNQQENLKKLAALVRGELSPQERRKIITLITIEVHARDVVARLVQSGAENHLVFDWQSQLRYSWDDDTKVCSINIADASFTYGYEYIGNCGCLVITPLTDRCYITLTQALRLVQGGAPAGPAGTGKTETTKDLGRALGTAVYVFNCSEQMGVISLGNIFKGLCMSGAWGCFDEFNRISIDVLSVVATQFKSILSAIAGAKEQFVFEGDMINLEPTVGVFITMNPGYKGRTELPENLKALFRPCAMVVPDLLNICEIMLASEGFESAKVLSKKFVTLYMLNRELLSKQDHYDWGLRAVKSVLVIAGGLKRAEPQIDEDWILMRALRDTNMAKLSRDDVDIFRGLIGDLFPEVDLPPKRDLVLEKDVRIATRDAKLQAGEKKDAESIEMFILKVVQLKELLDVRHSVFVLGPSGSGKSETWKTLARALTLGGTRVAYQVVNPKAVTNDELYGYVHKKTGEWRDGLLSVHMRNFAEDSKRNKNPKWIVLDGDIDADWIESMNTVMDDNKVLTLASNERIPLTSSMRMVFEISHLRNATPATVSRAGILFINETDIGWAPFKDSWVEDQPERHHNILLRLFDNYVPETLEYLRKNCKQIIPISDFAMVQNLCFLLEGILHPQHGHDLTNELFEHYFVFCVIWAMGGCLTEEGGSDYRVLFSKWFKKEFCGSSALVRFPDTGSIFDYYVDPECRIIPWKEMVPRYVHDADLAFPAIFVESEETVRLSYLANLLLRREDGGHPVMFVGMAGTGKTCIMQHVISNVGDDVINRTVNFNSSTDASTLQLILEQNIEKQGRSFGPPGRSRCIFFLDDLNMPLPDKYGTQSGVSLVRQHMDYGFWYDRQKQEQKKVKNIQYVAGMNPKAGSFTVDERLQRHFATFAVQPVSDSDASTIFGSIVRGFFEPFVASVRDLAIKSVDALIFLHGRVVKNFVPTSVRFHYLFTLRELSNVFQGVCSARPENYRMPQMFVRLWLHEVYRVYSDRLISFKDLDKFEEILQETVRSNFDEFPVEEIMAKPNIFTSFMRKNEHQEHIYFPVESYEVLRRALDERLQEYNESNAEMNLELFDDAMEHVCRISRILSYPRGNALLVGVGGSGKQSLARLASFIWGYDVHSIVVRAGYSMSDFRADVQLMYRKAAIKPGTPRTFLLNDGQIIDDRMLVYINDMLSSGNIPDLFTPDERQEIVDSMANEVKQLMIGDHNSKDFVWNYFVDKVRANLHVVLCFSPVGEQFRLRCRQYPALSNCTVIDWFHPWPQKALVSVANRFLRDMDVGSPQVMSNIAEFMAFVHHSVEDISQEYLNVERRYNYTTPKSFLESISLYKNYLGSQRNILEEQIQRLESGLNKLRSSQEQVAGLQQELIETQKLVKEKGEATDALLERVGNETNIVNEKRAIAEEERARTEVLEKEAKEFADKCKDDLEATKPVVERALNALNTLDKSNIGVLKSLGRPPPDVQDVAIAVYILTYSDGVPKNPTWNDAKRIMANPLSFISFLQTGFDIDHIPQGNVDAVTKYVNNPDLTPDKIVSKSSAASGLCEWMRNIVEYHNIVLKVRPLQEKLDEANARLQEAKESLAKSQEIVTSLEAQLQKLMNEYEKAAAEKAQIEEEQREIVQSLDLAERLVNGLKDEKIRWTASIEEKNKRRGSLVGDVLLAAAFLSYIGPFSRHFRKVLMEDKWAPEVARRGIPYTEGLDPLFDLLTDEAEVARWTNQGLPADRISQENGAIVTNCSRWPLLIDPQLQGVKWVKNMEAGNDLKVLQMSRKNFMRELKDAIQNGNSVLIENLGETIDAVLEPIISRAIIKRGRNECIQLGEEEVIYHPNFRLYLQTKLSNPHYRPEVSAQTTLLNFMVTEQGLEDQLLSLVVNNEKPELEEERVSLLKQMNEDKIVLKDCEDSLLEELNQADERTLLKNVALVESLENTKKKSHEIQAAMAKALETNEAINRERNKYRPSAVRGSLLFFLIDQLSNIDHMYQYSLESFMTIFTKGLHKSEPSEDDEQRVHNITKTTTETIFSFVSRGLFEAHKLIFSSMLTFRVMRKEDRMKEEHLNFLLRGPKKSGEPVPETCTSWLSKSAWESVLAYADLEDGDPPCSSLPQDIAVSWRRFKEWCEDLTPEDLALPSDWKNLSHFDKLLIVRCLRPDRITMALNRFVAHELGQFFVEDISTDLGLAFEDSTPTVPIFFILSPGVDPVKSVETLGKKYGVSDDNGNFWNVSLGQGQEGKAMESLDKAFTSGGWVILNNIHLMAGWLAELEKKLDRLAEGYDPSKTEGVEAVPRGHPDFRIFLSAEPSTNIPIGILQRCIKLTNEPPQGLRANMNRALANFSDEVWENSPKQAEFKALLFSLCFFHAVVVERKKFGSQGWNRNYPFNFGDLTTCVEVLNNYLDERPVPFEDLRYVFGEIMYGGHITDDWDRRLCNTYLEEYVRPEVVDGNVFFFEEFCCPNPANASMTDFRALANEGLAMETPKAFGLPANAEIGFRTAAGEVLFKNILELQPRGAAAGGGLTMQEKTKDTLNEILDTLPPMEFSLMDLAERLAEDRDPYQNVFMQECERMNFLIVEIKRSLNELNMGLAGELSMSEKMDTLMHSLFLDRVPETWESVSFASMRPLGSWMVNLMDRYNQLNDWYETQEIPKVAWLSGFFNPQSFLNAVMQTTARRTKSPLDKMVLVTDVLKKLPDQIETVAREGWYITGLYLEGARWDFSAGVLEDAELKELHPVMPVICVRAVPASDANIKDSYMCPVYKTQARGPGFVFTANLRTKTRPSKWTMAGCALLLDVVG